MSFLEESLRATGVELFAANPEHSVSVNQLDELGWNELFAEEPKAAVGVLAEVQGAELGVSRLLELAVASQLDGAVDVATQGFVLPLRATSFGSLTELDGSVLLFGAPESVVVPIRTSTGIELVKGLAVTEAVTGLDPHAQLRRVRSVTSESSTEIPLAVWERAIALASLELAEETLGVVTAELALAVDHVKNRHQFGVPLGTFQAVQHRLADVYVAQAAARSVTDLAWVDRDPALCAASLGAARKAFAAARVHCHQVMGAMGFTWEHRQHWYLRRGLFLDVLLDHRPALAAAVDTVMTSSQRSEIWS